MRKTHRLASRNPARLWFVATVVAMIGITIGAVFAASALVPHTVSQQTSGFQSKFVDVPAFNSSSAALSAAFAPSGSTSCTTPGTSSAPIAIGTTAIVNYYNGTASTGKCHAGNFSEVFNVTTVAGVAGSWNFTFLINVSSSSSGSPAQPVYTVYTFSTVYSTSSSTTKVDLTIYLEFGTFIPANGIQSINLLVSPA